MVQIGISPTTKFVTFPRKGKNMFKTLFFVFVMLFGLGLSTPAMAQVEKPALFATSQEVEVAYMANAYSVYVPSQAAKNPATGERRFSETVMFAELQTPHGWKWVIYPRGSALLWDGETLVGDARCGNHIRAFRYPTPKPVVVERPAPPPPPSPPPAPMGPPAPTMIAPRLTFVDSRPLNIPPVAKGNWYTHWWRDHPVVAGVTHVIVLGLIFKGHHSSPSGTATGGSTGPGK